MGRKINLEISEDNLSDKINAECELSILIGMDSLAYMLSDANRQIHLLRNYELNTNAAALSDEIGAVLLQDEYMRRQYKNVRVSIATKNYTLIPSRLYNPLEKKSYLQPLTQLSDQLVVRVDELQPFVAKNVYGIDASLFDTTTKFLPNGRIYHAGTAFLTALHQKNKAEGYRIFLQVDTGVLMVALMDRKDLIFINSFEWQSAKDFVYFLLLVFDQFTLDADEVPVFVAGKLVEDSEIYRLLFRYVRNIQFVTPPEVIRLSEKWNAPTPHLFFNLFGTLLCN